MSLNLVPLWYLVNCLNKTGFSTYYYELRSAFNELSGCQFLWDKTSSSSVDSRMRSAAGTSITREKVRFRIENIPVIKSTYSGLCLENRNGGDIYIYPGFIIIIDQNKNFALIDVHDLSVKGTVSKFLEEETIPSDAEWLSPLIDWTNCANQFSHCKLGNNDQNKKTIYAGGEA